MKDIMQKLAELEATAPKVTKKKMLKEDSATPPMNVSNKPASLKDVFAALSENVIPGQKPLPVLDPQNKQAGMGFVTSNNPAVQNMLKNLDPKDVQIVQAPGQPGQPQVGQQQQQQTGQPAQAGATGQPQAGQMQMKEKWDAETKVAPSEKGKYAGKTKAELTSQYNKLKASGPHHKGSPEFGKMRELAFAIRAKSDWGKVQEEELSEISASLAQSVADKTNISRRSDPRRKRQNAMARAKLDPAGVGQPGQYSHGCTPPTKAKIQATGDNPYNMREEEVEESGLQAYLGNKKYGKDGMNALRKAGREHAGKEKMANIRAKYDKMDEGAKVDRMVKHIEKSEKKLGKSKEKASDIAWATANKRGMLDNKNKKKVKEGDLPSSAGVDTKGAGLGAGRSATTLEGKKPDFLDLDKDGNKKEPMKKAAADKNKKKVKESMNHRISAARLEGKSHGLRGHAHSGKRYEDLDEIRAYHEGYKEGLDECYGQGVYETAMPATVGGMADQEMEEGMLGKAALGLAGAAALAGGAHAASPGKTRIDPVNPHASITQVNPVNKYSIPTRVDMKAVPKVKINPVNKRSEPVRIDNLDNPRSRPVRVDLEEFDMEEGNAFTGALAKTPKGGKFSVGGKSFTDTSSLEEYAFESLDNQLNALLNESTDVNEGLSVSISKGQENSPDSVTITAQDAEAEHLLAFVKNAGLGLFGDDNADTHSSAMSVQPSHGAPDEIGAGGAEIGVVDGHDGMMGLMQKLSGIQSDGAEDYADEEGGCGCEEGSCSCDDYDQPTNEEACMECGMMEAQCGCSKDKEMVDEVEDDEDHDEWHDKDGNVDPNGAHDAGGHYYRERDQVDEVETPDQELEMAAEDNAPDSDEAETSADEDAEAKEDAALAGADSGNEEEMNESEEDEEEDVAESNTFESIYKKFAMLESEEKEEEKEEDDEEEKTEKKGMSDKQAKFFGKKADKEKVDEWANQVGKGEGKGTDASFQQDIDFMTKIISGGLNKPKSTGQTTVPVIAGQTDRTHDSITSINESVSDWVKLAGIK